MLNFEVFANFESASHAVLTFLHQRLGLGLWMVTRTEGEDWIVLQAEDHGYGVKPGDVFRWSDSFCSQMIQGKGPRIAPICQLEPAYVNAPIGQQVKIGAYVGVPLTYKDGSLFGTLCAIDPNPQSETLTTELLLVELLAQLLSSVLHFSLEAAEESRQREMAMVEACKDSLTGLYNRRGWDKFLDAEEYRCRQFGSPATVIVIDLDDLKKVNDIQGHGAGDRLIVQAAQVMAQAVRKQDIVARIGGDEFAILCSSCGSEEGQLLIERLEDTFLKHHIHASLGIACRHPSQNLEQVLAQADQAMYDCKKRRKKKIPGVNGLA